MVPEILLRGRAQLERFADKNLQMCAWPSQYSAEIADPLSANQYRCIELAGLLHLFVREAIVVASELLTDCSSFQVTAWNAYSGNNRLKYLQLKKRNHFKAENNMFRTQLVFPTVSMIFKSVRCE